jgi:very-short-patch-repair endonuclease
MMFIDCKGRRRPLKLSHRKLIKWDEQSRSKVQTLFKTIIRPFWCYDIVLEELPVLGTKMTLDFYNASRKIAVEVDGNQHYQFNSFFHQTRRNFALQLFRDDYKEKFCEVNHIKLIRIPEKDVPKITKETLIELELIDTD